MYLKSEVLLLADVFQNFTRMCVEINHSVFAKFLSAPGLAWQATLKKAKVEKLPVNGVKWLEDISEFDDSFM